MTGEVILRLENISKRYDEVHTGAAEPDVLRGLSLTVRAGDSVAIVGPSGCGKSTLLNLMGALDRPTSGKVEFQGVDLGTLSEGKLASFRNERIGFVFQSHHLLPQCSAIENVLVPTLVHSSRRRDPAIVTRAETLLNQVGLSNRMHHRPGQLSGGECQRVAVVRALINDPALLLADEPTGSLDGESASQLGRLLCDLNRDSGVTLITVTHSAELAGLMRRTLELQGGMLRDLAAEAAV